MDEMRGEPLEAVDSSVTVAEPPAPEFRVPSVAADLMVVPPAALMPPGPEGVASNTRNVTPFPKPIETFTTSPEFDQLIAALVLAQQGFGEVERILTAHVASKREGARSFSYDYAPLSEVIRAVRPMLNAHGIALLQPPVARASSVVVTTLLAHRSGQWFRNDCPLPVSNMDPQAFGSAVTYLRRYTLQSILGIAPEDGEDNDGQRAMPPTSAAAAGTTGPRGATVSPAGDAWRSAERLTEGVSDRFERPKSAAPSKDLMPTRVSASAPAPTAAPAAPAALLVATLEPRKKTGTNTPYWILNLSDKRRLVTFNRELAERAGGWVIGQRAVVVEKTHTETHGGVDWVFVDAMSAAQ